MIAIILVGTAVVLVLTVLWAIYFEVNNIKHLLKGKR